VRKLAACRPTERQQNRGSSISQPERTCSANLHIVLDADPTVNCSPLVLRIASTNRRPTATCPQSHSVACQSTDDFTTTTRYAIPPPET